MDMVKTMTMDGKRYQFICRSWGTRSGFAHGCDMVDMERWEIVARNKSFYLNRTWECWDFQSCILGAIRNAMDAERQEITERVKDANGWAKLTAKRREAVDEAVEASADMKTLKKLFDEVGKYRPAWDY